MLPAVQTPRPLTQTDRDPFGEVDRIVRDLTTWADAWRWPDDDGVMRALGDLEELDDAFVLEVDLPGIAKGDVDVDPDGVRAQLADGVLTVRLPKTSTGRRRRITVH